jgi:aspartyl-tRNA(Asn)/glutamyl-tRNA(Gln) amidotransferase subunit A
LFAYSSIEEYHTQLKEGSTTCLEAVEYYLSRIEASKNLNAFIHVYAEEARQRAKALDQQSPGGKLHGVVIGLKDVIAYKDHPLSAASSILNNFISIFSATVVERLLAEGAIIIGSLNCDEFAMGSSNENSIYGNVHNAIDHSRVPGGSSGGSAVAVQAGLCMLSLGSDTGGSVRQPADFCGIIGFKPTYGRISRYGLVAYASSFDQIGIFGNNIPDIARVLEVIAGKDDYDSTVSSRQVEHFSDDISSFSPFRFAYFEEALNHESLDPEIKNAILQKIALLKAEGHEVSPVSFKLLDYIVPAYYVLTTAEASSNLSRYDGVKYGYRTAGKDLSLADFYELTRSEGFGKEVKRRIMLGTFVLSAGYYDAYFTRAQQVRQLVRSQLDEIFKNYHFLIMPTSPSTAWHFGEKSQDPIAMYLADIYTVMANLTGNPAISLPLFRHSNKMPFGLQLLSGRFQELPLLKMSHQLMNKAN